MNGSTDDHVTYIFRKHIKTVHDNRKALHSSSGLHNNTIQLVSNNCEDIKSRNIPVANPRKKTYTLMEQHNQLAISLVDDIIKNTNAKYPTVNDKRKSSAGKPGPLTGKSETCATSIEKNRFTCK